MKSAQEIFDHYTSSIRQAKTIKERKKALNLWNEAYNSLSETHKTEIKIILKQRASALLSSQTELDKRIAAAGLSSFEEFYHPSTLIS